MSNEKYKIHEQDKFLKKNKAKFETKQKDIDALKPKKQTMNGILDNVLQGPEKLHIVGPVGKTSARETKPSENPEHGKDGKEFSE